MGEVIWTEPALGDVREILTYIQQDSEKNSLLMGDRLADAPNKLGQFPQLGARVPEFDIEHLRELLVRPYRLIIRSSRQRLFYRCRRTW